MKCHVKFFILFFLVARYGAVQAEELEWFSWSCSDRSIEGCFLPPSTPCSPVIFATPETDVSWLRYLAFVEQMQPSGFGFVALGKQVGYENLTRCLQNLPFLVGTQWNRKVIFLDESESGELAVHLANSYPYTAAVILFAPHAESYQLSCPVLLVHEACDISTFDDFEVFSAINRWLQVTLLDQEVFKQQTFFGYSMTPSFTIKELDTDKMEYEFSLVGGRASISAGYDSDGNKSLSAEVEYKNDNSCSFKAEGGVKQDSDGHTKGEVKTSIGKDFD